MAGENVVPLKVRKFRKQILNRIATRKIFQNGFHRVTQASHAWLPMANLRVNRDP